MKKLIELYPKDRLEVAGLATKTVKTYLASIASFCDFARVNCNIAPLNAQGKQLQDWLENN